MRWFRRTPALSQGGSNGVHDDHPPLPFAMQTLFEVLEDGVVWLAPAGTIRFSNQTARQLLGEIPAEELARQPLWELARQPGLRQVIDRARRISQGQATDLSIFTPTERLVRLYVVPQGGAADGAIVVLRDMTALRRLERVRQDFVANVSHELRTPLTSLRGFIETLLNGAVDDASYNRQFLRLMEGDVNRLVRLTDDLLELSRAESLGHPKILQAVDVLESVQRALDTLGPQIKSKRLHVSLDHFGALPPATGDPDQLHQVFWNLLDNAVKYNVEGGSLTVRLRYHKAWLYVDVADSGIGMRAEELPRIFERFYRIDKARSRELGGTGLGLAIVKHIVEAHEGRIEVESQPGVGSTFRVILPIWPPAKATPQ